MKFIEGLYYGDLNPMERSYPMGSPLKKTGARAADLEASLLAVLSEEAKKLFLDHQEATGELHRAENLDSFVTGFRYGASFTYDTFLSEDAPLRDYHK